MSAYDEIIKKNGSDNLAAYRKALVSQSGSMISGSIPEFMGLSTRARNRVFEDDILDEVDDETKVNQLAAIFIKKLDKSTRDYGFVFNKEGTEAIIRELIAGNPLAIDRKFADFFRFEDEKKANLWSEAAYSAKKRLISKDLMQLRKKTDIQYRVHGSRLHYLTLGKVSAIVHETSRAQRMVFPLFLFDCIDTDYKRNLVEIEQSGFVNFAMDEKYFDSEIKKLMGGFRVEANNDLPSKLTEVKRKIENINLPNLDDVKVDVTFSMISVITGFVAEYLDKVWDKIL